MSATSATGDSFLDIPAPTQKRTRKKTAASPRAVVVKKPPVHDSIRTSEVLRNLLVQNPTLKSFTIEKILTSIGTSSFGTSLMFFAIPEVLPIPIPGVAALMVLPTGVLSAQMVAGQQQVSLPKFLLKRSVSRKALAMAIHMILPILRKAEKVTKPRWHWATTPGAQRLLGAFIFLLAASIAFPIPGFNMPQAIAIFIIGLGLVERDGLIICLGVLVGLASLLLLGGVVVGLSSLIDFSMFAA